MKTTILFLSVALLAGCSMRDTVNIEDMTTTQAYDLSDKDSDGVMSVRKSMYYFPITQHTLHLSITRKLKRSQYSYVNTPQRR